MTGIVDWAASRARMVVAFILLSLAAGAFAYVGLPKEGEPDIEIPALFVSVSFPGISAEDSEKLLVQVMETELSDLDGLKSMQGTAAENYAGVAMEFEFGWEKTKIMADVRDAMNSAEAQFPSGADKYSINEINFSEFPIVIVNLTGNVPERTLVNVAKGLQDKIEAMESVLEASLTGSRDEMLEVTIDPLKLEAYNVTAGELITVVQNNNQLIAAGEIETAGGKFAVKIPSSFDEPQDVYNLPVKVNGDRVITLGDLAVIKLAFEDREGTARFNGEKTVALQVVKRKGFNLIDTTEAVKELVKAEALLWPVELQKAIKVGTSNDQSRNVASMVSQLEGSVLTAIALVMIVVLAALGMRPALLVGFAIPTSFLLCFVLLGVMGITISNIVMFGLILAVGMLVDGAIVVVEYADRRIREGAGPMTAYVEAAKRMFWPIVSSTATTLCAFLPMLFWPGVPGQFMGMLPVTLIFVLSASLIVALVYLPVLGGVTARLASWLEAQSSRLASAPIYIHVMVFIGAGLLFAPLGFADSALVPQLGPLFAQVDATDILGSAVPSFLAMFAIVLFTGLSVVASIAGVVVILVAILAVIVRVKRFFAMRLHLVVAAIKFVLKAIFGHRFVDWLFAPRKQSEQTLFGHFIHLVSGNPIGPLVSIAMVFVVVGTTFVYFGANNKGVEFFVESEPEQAIVYVQARGNLGLEEKDELVKQAEEVVLAHLGVITAFSFAGEGALGSNTGGAAGPADQIGQVQFETIPWEDRKDRPDLDGDIVVAELETALAQIPGIRTEILTLSAGPAAAKPVHLRIKGDNFEDLKSAAAIVHDQFRNTTGLIQTEDSLPLPGIDFQIDVNVEKAGRFGADVATVGGMVQLVTRGILLDTMRVDSSDEEIEIRVRLPEKDRVLSTLDTLKLRTATGLVPLSNFVTRTPVASLAQIDRIDGKRFFDVKAAVEGDLIKLTHADTGDVKVEPASVLETNSAIADQVADGTLTSEVVTPNERIAVLTEWLETKPLPNTVEWEWTGDQEDQAESGAFLSQAFLAALGLMFIILLAQFNSVYNSVLVLLAVVLSTTGVLIGMLVMDQAFSIIMTGTGIVALAGIVVNNNIVLIDTYQEYSKYMPRIEAITRTAETRIRPVLLTTITTMAGLAPMMYGLSLDFFGGGYTINSPTALWWKQLATAVVFGLGIATVLTLVFTPSMLALRVWVTTYAKWIARLLAKLSFGRGSRAAQDWALNREAKRIKTPEIIWDFSEEPQPIKAAQSAKKPKTPPATPLQAAE